MRVFAFLAAQTWALAIAQYAPHTVVVAFARDVIVYQLAVAPERLHALQALNARGELRDADVPQYTSEAHTNRALIAMGVERIQRLFNAPNVGPVYRMSIESAVPQAVKALHSLATVTYASPDWYVEPMQR